MDPLIYRIRVGAALHPGWSAWFDGLTIAPGPNDSTILAGPIADQAALHGVLAKIRDLGLTLLSVDSCAAGDADVLFSNHNPRGAKE